MTKLGIKVIGLLVILVWLTGCATMGDVIRDKDKGTATVYPVSADQAWEIAKTVFRWEGTDAIEEHQPQGYMLTSSSANLLTWGTVMGCWVEPVDNNNTKVTIVTKRKDQTDFFTTLTETTFHKQFAQAVGIVRKGDKLPSKPPTTEPQTIPPDKPTVSTPVTSPSATTIVTVTWTFANIRSGAGNNYPVVTTVKQGDKLTVIGELGEWFNVRLEDGKEGWISNKVVK